jgi:organic radical activating enzyme
MIFKTGRTNLACTIFVPFDCKNNCSFCTSKESYSKFNKDLNKILEDIKILNQSDFFVEYVLTGGEPISDFEGLKKIVDTCNKRVFINTTLPLQDNLFEIIEYFNTENKIAGINISRHIGHKFKDVADKDTIDKIKKPIRINTTVPIQKSIRFFMMMFPVFFALVNPASTMANPACIQNTRAAPAKNQTANTLPDTVSSINVLISIASILIISFCRFQSKSTVTPIYLAVCFHPPAPVWCRFPA